MLSSRLLSILVFMISALWMGLTIYTEIIDESPSVYSINSPEMKQRMASCAGNFQQRQACAEKIAEELQQRGFLDWIEKVAVIMGPPLILWGLLSYARRERPAAAVATAHMPSGPRRLHGDSPAPGGPMRAPGEPGAAHHAPPMSAVREPDAPIEDLPPPSADGTPVGRRAPIRRGQPKA